MKDLADRAISKSNDLQLQEEFENILATCTKDSRSNSCRYEDLLKGQYKLTKVFRLQRKKDAYDVWGKTADLSLETIKQLIEEGDYDAAGMLS
jgi:3-methyladenine DNA glycosylase Mpg